MKVHEYQARDLFKTYNIPVNDYKLVSNAKEAREASMAWKQVVVKAQVLVGGRGKAGGVKLANSPEEVEAKAAVISGLEIGGYRVDKMLVCDSASIEKEYYLGLILDRSRQGITLMLTDQGGVDIEELAEINPSAIHRLTLHPHKGIDGATLDSFLANSISLEGLRRQAISTIKNLYSLFLENDASLVEINPYALTPGGKMLALDSKINFDDNALFKHPEIEALRNPEESSPDELEARTKGLSFVSLDGDIGCMVNGAGLAMATLDLIELHGGKAANFLDVGGSSNPQKAVDALGIILRNNRIKAILINIFGGITRCDDIANGLLMARKKLDIDVPLIIRLVGTNEKEGRAILKEAGLDAIYDLDDAVRKVIRAARGVS
ncbi:Succinyl-CoA ligase [ADP-forming] beta chain [Olavius algarvensis spirochete endosymbiont]|uniref:ADP-forming succinate--CoA ligase subunit beta n=1 Tax=Olavius algarvensis spirochete endosymbiont TaxID=260710 RepID=UPI000F10B26A|nr:ADP-forming succinate--CoA ligase subunit beta [Olavius algarvensis spirochete endosymbiont]VDB00722.1 Succinyl-CoA ligase [ADP-forming] beta chain [Olavius algarvensis spirochete endosymbiont]